MLARSRPTRLAAILAGSQLLLAGGLAMPARADASAGPWSVVVSGGGRLGPAAYVVSTAPGAQVTRVALGGAPAGVAVTPDGNRSLVVDDADGGLDQLDLGSAAPRRLAHVAGVAPGAAVLALTPDGKTALVPNPAKDTVSVFDLAAPTPRRTAVVHVGKAPVGVATSPDGTRAWVALSGEGAIQAIDLTQSPPAAGAVLKLPDAPGGGASGLVISPDANTAYVLESGSTFLNAVPLGGGKTQTISVCCDPIALALTPDGTHLYVTDNLSGGVVTPIAVVGTRMTKGKGVASRFASGIAITPDGRAIYVTDRGNRAARALGAGNTVSAFDIAADPMKPALTRTIKLEPSIAADDIFNTPDPGFVGIQAPVPTRFSGEGSLAAALPTPAEVIANPRLLAISTVVGTVGALLITFPAQMFNLTFDENYPTIAGWIEARRRRLSRLLGRVRTRPGRDGGGASIASGPLPFVLVLLAGTLLSGLLDRKLAPDLRSAAELFGIMLALLAGVLIRGAVTGAYYLAGRQRARPSLHALPLGLAIGAACVAVSLATKFEPGYLYGIVCGIVFPGVLHSLKREGQVAWLSAWATLAFGFAGWIFWASAVHHAAMYPRAPGPLVGISDFLAAFFVSSLVGNAISLVPIRFLPGAPLKAWNKWVWGVTFGFALLAVADVLVASSKVAPAGTRSGQVFTAVALFVGFMAVSIGTREYFARPWRKAHNKRIGGFREWLQDLLTPHQA